MCRLSARSIPFKRGASGGMHRPKPDTSLDKPEDNCIGAVELQGFNNRSRGLMSDIRLFDFQFFSLAVV